MNAVCSSQPDWMKPKHVRFTMSLQALGIFILNYLSLAFVERLRAVWSYYSLFVDWLLPCERRYRALSTHSTRSHLLLCVTVNAATAVAAIASANKSTYFDPHRCQFDEKCRSYNKWAISITHVFVYNFATLSSSRSQFVCSFVIYLPRFFIDSLVTGQRIAQFRTIHFHFQTGITVCMIVKLKKSNCVESGNKIKWRLCFEIDNVCACASASSMEIS